MNLYTQCLNLCFLLVSLNPAIAMQAIFGQKEDGHGFKLLTFLKAVSTYYSLMLVSIALISPKLFSSLSFFRVSDLGLALALIPLVLGVEILFSHLLRCQQKGSWLPLEITFVGTTKGLKELCYPLAIAFFEELTYRLIWFTILMEGFKLPALLVLIISSFCYAWNHLLMGKAIFYAKLLTGLMYGTLYIVSQSIWLVIIIHVGGNLLVESLSRWQLKEKKVMK
ncbi:CPBP family intramembrane glutamic endopeptidase [Streptococcus ictaluri]|uniref:CAAX amino terminal protease family protein n=1 Tax=Streptococcus ictaluri 707-05 TaxID=764299 RepID=G5K155_9STRE|nr:CPBP family intramembrane glutamic endopeptidase [Streptococcus ictaluri]EHI70341.1 CAAX amino terminal protease family protein [Streptococcus ictaluri 707-05]